MIEVLFCTKATYPPLTTFGYAHGMGETTLTPWQQKDWLEQISMWLSSRLNANVVLESGSTSDLRFITRFQLESASFYFKAGNKTREARLTAYLAQTYPKLVPEVIVYNAEHDWLVTRDGGQHLSLAADLNFWKTALTTLTYFHRNTDRLAAQRLGCPFYSFAELASRVEAFLRSTAGLEPWGLTKEQIQGLNEGLPRFHEAYEKVSSLGFRECFIHGDAQPMNALVNDRELLWFDWSEGHVAHPFLDVGWFFAWTSLPKRDLELFAHQNATVQLWNHYLREVGLEQSQARLADAMTVALLHRALYYHERFYTWVGSSKPQYVPYCPKLFLKLNDTRHLSQSPHNISALQ
jgi:hypothetical protein